MLLDTLVECTSGTILVRLDCTVLNEFKTFFVWVIYVSHYVVVLYGVIIRATAVSENNFIQ